MPVAHPNACRRRVPILLSLPLVAVLPHFACVPGAPCADLTSALLPWPACCSDLFKERSSVTLADLYSTYMQTYNEQKRRQQQQQLGGQPQQQQPGEVQYRSISQAQMQMAVLQLTDMVNMRGGVLTRKNAAAAGGDAGPAGVPVEVA